MGIWFDEGEGLDANLCERLRGGGRKTEESGEDSEQDGVIGSKGSTWQHRE